MTRDRILAAAVDEFAEKGFFGARVDSIAEASGINKRMIYAHFESKENLYSEVLHIAYEEVAESEKGYMVEGLDPISSIKNIVKSAFSFFLENPGLVRLLMWENLNQARFIPKGELTRLNTPTVDYIKREIRRGKELGVFRADADERHLVLSLMSFGFSYFSNAYTMSALLGRELTSRDEVISRSEFITDMVIKYLQA